MTSHYADNLTNQPFQSKCRYSVSLDHESFSFCASHFITFPIFSETSFQKKKNFSTIFSSEKKELEPLHGHDFRVRAIIFGFLNQNHYVLDFIAASEILKSVLAPFQHKILLAENHPQFRYESKSVDGVTELEVRFQKSDGKVKRWIFPQEDILLLPLENTTTEEMARIIAVDFFERITKGGLLEFPPEHYNLFLELEESRGMSAQIFYNPNSQFSSFSACDDNLALFSWRR
ncbi:MAG: 6-carboxytetrahydropterin synthase [Planctomycetia bacterium]|nr:6-carboxytetrahydropterin synthase [Planctomycetia bacterium]